jgi:hypothetical protein
VYRNVKIFASTVLAATYLFCAGAAGAQPVPFDSRAFNALGEKDRYEFVLAALRSRESQLENFSYSLKCVISLVGDEGTAGKAFGVDSVELRRLGPKTFIHVNPTRKGEQREQTWSSWDGTVRRSRHLRTDGRNTGRIADTELALVNETRYNEILGFRVLTPIKGVGYVGKLRSEWLDIYHSVHKRPLDVRAVDDQGKTLLYLKLQTEQDAAFQLWLDPQRDFMLVKERYDVKSGADDRGFSDTEVSGATQADGLWVPTRATQVRNNSVKAGNGSRDEYEVSSFLRNKVRDADLAVDFVPGADVLDARTQTAYRVAADGKLELLPVFDSDTGLTKRPDQTAKEVFATAKDPFQPNNRRRNTGLAVVAGLLLVAAVAYAVRRRGRNPA